MYVMTFHLKPTAGLTFRILPGSILDIATYPFVPPTTLSGFLRRLAMMSVGLEFPNTGPNDENTPFFALPRELIALGAYPAGACTRPAHRTYRKGPRDLGHTAFSSIFRGKAKATENIQLHTWEYLIAEDLVGYVASENGEELNRLAGLVGYGAKIGKEGFAFVTSVSGPFPLSRAEVQAKPSTVAPADELFRRNTRVVADVYPLYSFVWRGLAVEQSQAGKKGSRAKATQQAREYSSSSFDQHPSPITKYKPFVAAWLDNHNHSGVTLDFWHDDNVFIPASLLDILRGEISDEA
jgi:hypothetical protein